MVVLKDLVRQVDGYKGLDVWIVVDLRIVLVTVDHHALLGVLNKVGVITSFFPKLLSADTNQTSSNCPVSAILDIYPVSALAIYALNFQCCLANDCVRDQDVLIENRKL